MNRVIGSVLVAFLIGAVLQSRSEAASRGDHACLDPPAARVSKIHNGQVHETEATRFTTPSDSSTEWASKLPRG